MDSKVSETSICRSLVVAITDCMQSLGPTHNDPIPQVLATQFDAGGQKCICFSRRICHRGKTVFVQRARSLFVLDSFTHHITCGSVPRSSILPFMDGKISNSFQTSFYCLASWLTEIVGVFPSPGLMSLFATMCQGTKMSFSIT